jgi:hypothetical protein
VAHVEAPVLPWNVPAAHVEHAFAATAEYVPTPQIMHAVALVLPW